MGIKGMTIIEFKDNLQKQKSIVGDVLFYLDNGDVIPPYFHITEMGLKVKNFVDCGGVQRRDKNITFQLWTAEDFHHRITPSRILEVIEKFEETFILEDIEIEIEYNTNTIGLYSLTPHPKKDLSFVLLPKKTNCLAPDKCGIGNKKEKTFLSGYDMENVRKDTTKPTQCGPSCC